MTAIAREALTEAEIKLTLIRLIDQLTLEELLEMLDQFDEYPLDEVNPNDLNTVPVEFEGDPEEGYRALAEDKESREEAEEWAEGTLLEVDKL